LVDMRTPGIRAEPITTMAGTHEFAEVFIDEARVPVSSVLGEIDGGWRVATGTLSYERAGVASLYLMLRKKLDRLLVEAAAAGVGAVARDELVQRYIQVRTLELLAKR